jgi:deoxyribonuclease-4
MHFLGAHTIDNGGIDMAVRRAANAGMRAVQIFSAVPKFYNERIGVKPERAARFRAAIAGSGIKAPQVMVHAAYVLNVATPDETKWGRANAGLAKELERATTLGAGLVCFHPGAATDGDRAAGVRRIARAITHALETVDGESRLLVENTAGAGTTIAKTSEEIAAILSDVPRALRRRTGYGLDTCHLFSSGYDIAQSAERLTTILDEFEELTGEPPSFFHLNDSAGALGSNKDRHVLIGDGEIGTKAFEWLMRDRRSQNIPLILETPQQNYDIADDDDSADPYDLRMMKMLGAWI